LGLGAGLGTGLVLLIAVQLWQAQRDPASALLSMQALAPVVSSWALLLERPLPVQALLLTGIGLVAASSAAISTRRGSLRSAVALGLGANLAAVAAVSCGSVFLGRRPTGRVGWTGAWLATLLLGYLAVCLPKFPLPARQTREPAP
jgi:hypothetical protein